ncbi:MAG: hypothetical protein M1821_000284 [Bathelium mastoideum]|nr:MAG: hypothetical protein M1821_000284 [Bathelium mastoideum]KAI9681065.1 MAG: hypothetical protein M1822_007139 [Bathelium mastoideum]
MPSFAPFKIGQRQVFLPNFTLTLLRTPRLPPNFASFIVPLDINKLDIRDYLFHAYGITCLRVRSYVQQQRIQHGQTTLGRLKPRTWHRPRSVKRMTVEMDKPFVWPEEPDNFEPWSKETRDATEKEQKEYEEKHMSSAYRMPPKDGDLLAEQAQRLLSGKEKWRPQWQVDAGTGQSPRWLVEPETRTQLRP